MFYQHLNENLSDTLVDPAGRLKEGEDPMDYVNTQAFQANLMSVDLMSMGHLFCVLSFLEHIMDGAFNKDHSKEPPQIRDAWVMGAAQWIKWRQKKYFAWFRSPVTPRSKMSLSNSLSGSHARRTMLSKRNGLTTGTNGKPGKTDSEPSRAARHTARHVGLLLRRRLT
jgi:hypothetical protein